MGDDGEVLLEAARDDAGSDRRVVERVPRELNGANRREVERLVELAKAHVADADLKREPVAVKLRERTHGGVPGDARIGRVNEEEIRRPAQRGDAGLRVLPKRLRAAIGAPTSRGARHPSFGDHERRGRLAKRRAQAPLVLAQLQISISVRSVEDGDSRLERCRDRRLELGVGQPHASKTELGNGCHAGVS